jgi:hypothetical protein
MKEWRITGEEAILAVVISLLGAAGAQPEQSLSTAAFRQLTSRVGQWIAVYWDRRKGAGSTPRRLVAPAAKALTAGGSHSCQRGELICPNQW